MQVAGAPTAISIVIKSWPGAETHQDCDLLLKYPYLNGYLLLYLHIVSVFPFYVL